MLWAAATAAGGVARSLVAAAVGAAGTVIGAAVGLLTGFFNENGLLRAALIGAVTGALVSVDLADALLRIWTSCDDCSMDTRIKRTRLVLRTFAAGRHLRGCVFPTISGALDAQMDALPHQSAHHYFGSSLADGDDLFEPSSAVMAARRAVVESLPSTTLTKETAAAGLHTTCPICLYEFNAGESTRRLPACSHVFHLACIDSWLLWKPQCPMCRRAVY
ncbi:NEP1-interacting protein 2-like [Lolium perenne]|uniref:NEP1-interacting protein 2-like n=1 Tax=Lolium perenne TaxID=4522 RepID=UPI0021F5C861|nr:NEP1-interacting protein 2-like isoform X1 [Lolium perenne]